MPGEVDGALDRANGVRANSPFDSPEVALRFNSLSGINSASPSPHQRVPAMLSGTQLGWNVRPPTAQRAVSAGHRLGSSNGSTSNLSASNSSQSVGTLGERYQQVKHLDAVKNSLLEELWEANQQLQSQLQRVKMDYQRESDSNKDNNVYVKDLQNHIRQLGVYMAQDPFVLVLIDGDELAFAPDLIMRGHVGGGEAAARLNNQILDYALLSDERLQQGCKILARVYVDVKKISEAYCKAGLVSHPSVIENFVAGFNAYDSHFELVHVSSGGSGSATRIYDIIKLHLRDPHCRRMFLGCASTASERIYTRLQDHLEHESQPSAYLTLIEPESDEGQVDCALDKARVHGLFTDHGMDLPTVGGAAPSVLPTQSTGFPTPPPSMPSMSRQLSSISIQDVRDFTPSMPVATPASAISTSSSPHASPGNLNPPQSSIKPVSNTWAALASKPPPPMPVAPPAPARASQPVDNTIPRNVRGQRVDPPMKHDKADVDRIKKMKMCNVHYLRGECEHGDTCVHSHKYKPTKSDLETLRLVARMAPCVKGSDCEEPRCIYGHICPAPEGRRGEPCIFGDMCKFPTILHAIDRKVIKTIRV